MPSPTRYDICPTVATQQWLIYDDQYPWWGSLCKLPDEEMRLVPLKFTTKQAAEAWINNMWNDPRSPAQQQRELDELVALVDAALR